MRSLIARSYDVFSATASMTASSSSTRHSTRTSLPPLSLAEEQAASALSRWEERDVADALLSSLRDSWSDEEEESDAAEESEEEEEEGEEEEEEEEEKKQAVPAVDEGGWSAAVCDFPSAAHYTRSGGSGRPLRVAADSTPFDLLQLFLPLRLVEEFAHHTNAAAPFGWRPTTAQELYAFLGVHIYMGIDRLPETELYWTGNYVHSFITNLFTRDRFKQIRRCFSVVEHDPDSQLRDPIAHVRALSVRLNASFAAHYKPSRELTMDEAMVAFKGRAGIKQYMPMKPHKWGYKIWCLASDHYLLRFEVYEGAAEDASLHGATFDTVLRMIEGYENKHHTLFCDSWFTSPTLLDALKENGILCCGSVRRNRKGMPPMGVISKKAVKQLQQGEYIQRQKGDTTACVWKDRKAMWVLYNHTSPAATTTIDRWKDNGNRIPIGCPQAVSDYFHHARSVDVINQLHYSYPTGRKSKRCWSRLVWWLLDICIVNAFQLWSTENQHARQLDFRDQLMRQLAEQLPPEQKPHRASTRPNSATALAKDHFPERTAVERRCAQCCSGRQGRRVESSFICNACGVHLCIGECFAAYHAQQ
jgi:hypothetical protein